VIHRLPVSLLAFVASMPGLYPLLAFLTARRAVVRGWSMHPTLAPGERVLFDRLAYRLGAPARGDVVLAAYPARPHLALVKRVAAVPGDAVAIDGERCWVNGVAVTGEPSQAGPPEARTLGDDEYLLLGDAPAFSTDSRELGPAGREQIQARGWMVYWPVRRMRSLVKQSEGQTEGQT